MFRRNQNNRIANKILENVPANHFTPRHYHVDLLDAVLERNSIICSPKKSITSYIALSLLKYLVPKNSDVVLYLTSDEPDTEICEYFYRHTGLPCATYTHAGTLQWSRDEWAEELASKKILVMSAKLYVQLLLLPGDDEGEGALLPLTDIHILIVTDCHSALESDTPLYFLMEHYRPLSQCGLAPRLLALSSELLHTDDQDPIQVEEQLEKLEEVMDARAETASDMLNMFILGARPEETVILCKPYENTTEIGQLIERLLRESLEFLMDLEMSDQDETNANSPLKTLNYCLRALNECLRILKSLGVWCCYRIAKVFVQNLITLEVKEKVEDEKVRLLRYTSSQLTLVARLYITAFEDIQDLDQFQEFISPKVHELVKELKKYKPTLEFTIEGVEPPIIQKLSSESPDKAGSDNGDGSEDDGGSDSSFTESDAEITDDETRNDMGGPLIKKRGQRKIRRNTRKKTGCKQVKFAPACGTTNPRLLYRGIALPPKTSTDEGSATTPSPRLCAAVLVSSQFTAFALSRLLEELCFWDEDLYFIKPGHLFALNCNSDKSGAASLNAKQEEVIRKFRFGEINVLMATRFIDSGLELPKCCLVVRFDPPDSFTSYLHSKGKGRITQSVFLHLVEEGEEEKIFSKQYERFCRVEKILVKRCESHNIFTEDDALDEEEVDSLTPAFLPCGHDGMKMPLSKSIDCLNRYCARLPSDAFTHLTPEWAIQEVQNQTDHSQQPLLYRCSIKLPMNSPFKQTVWGDLMENKTLAKMSAALHTIKELHRVGELDDSLNPVGKTEVYPNLGLLIKEKLVEEVNDDGTSVDPMLVGSTKRRQYYHKRVAKNLSDCLIKAGEISYLYYIDLNLQAPLPDHQNIHGRPCYYPESESKGFALLLNKPLEKIPRFPIYTRSGEESVDFLPLSNSLILNQSQIDQLIKFHHILYQGVLRLEKDASMMFHQNYAYCQVLVVPVDKDSAEIEWSFILQVCDSYCREENVCKVPPRFSKGKFEFREDDYINAVVMPSYRNFDQPQHYYVAEIRHDLSPLSAFPSEMYDTFEEYFNKKYNKRITNKQQPLLDADFTAIRLNLLSPRYITHKGHPLPVASEEKKKSRREDIHQKQLLLSELCFRHPFPASVWRKAVCLPTIFYRLNYLLLAEELRRVVAIEAKIGLVHPPDNYEFMSLDKLLSTATYQQDDSVSRSSVVARRDEVPRYVDQKSLMETQILEDNEDFGIREIGDSSTAINGSSYDDDDAESVDSFEGDVRFCRPIINDSDSSATDKHLFEPSPSLILQCLTMSCSHDFVNLERLETVGDSFLKFAVTVHHYIIYKNAHEGKLSHLRSRQVCNMNLYRLGKAKGLGECLVASKFEPYENWTPPGYFVKLDPSRADIMKEIEEKMKVSKGISYDGFGKKRSSKECGRFHYCVRNQQSLTDKSIADSVEALIGCYLTCRGHVTALRVMRWLGIDCMQDLKQSAGQDVFYDDDDGDNCFQSVWPLEPVPEVSLTSPEIEDMLRGYDVLETIIQYKFRNRSYLLQAFTHASYHYNKSTDCYQRLEFLGDAVLDYVITRFLYEDSLRHSPGVLTDLRSALVNNNIFAALAVKWEFHRFFKCCSPELLSVIDRFVRYQKDFNKDNLDFISNENLETYDSTKCGATVQHTQVMDSPSHLQTIRFTSDNGDSQKNDAIEIPKALGDIFESLAGAVFLDSNMSLDTVWRVFYRLMKERIDRYTACIPKSPVRELLEMEPDTANFEQPKRTGDGKIRVIVHIIGKGRFCAEGRNYRIAKSLAAKRALRALKELRSSNVPNSTD